MINCSFCLDLPSFRQDPCIKIVNGIAPMERKIILKTGGANRKTNGNRSVAVLSGLDGLEAVAALPYMVITSLEAVFGEKAIFDDGQVIKAAVPADPAMATLYNEIYDQTPIQIEGVTYTPPRLFGVPSGVPIDHLNA